MIKNLAIWNLKLPQKIIRKPTINKNNIRTKRMNSKRFPNNNLNYNKTIKKIKIFIRIIRLLNNFNNKQ